MTVRETFATSKSSSAVIVYLNEGKETMKWPVPTGSIGIKLNCH